MSETTDKQYIDIYEILGRFGLNVKEISIYLLLLKRKYLSALEISRETQIPRTQVYRLLEEMIRNGWISIKLEANGKVFVANSYKQFESVIAQKEEELDDLKTHIPLVFEQLAMFETQEQVNKTKVLYYQGIEGLKQVTWNSLRAKNELLIYEISTMSAFLDNTFAEKVRQEVVRRKINIKAITNTKKLDGYTKVKELMKYWIPRYIDPSELEIKLEFLIYNDVFVAYNYNKDQRFCVEIYSKQLADMHRQLFYYMWGNAKNMKILNDEGAAEVA